MGGLAAALGPSVGAAVVDALGWRWAFFLDLPVGLYAWWRGQQRLTEWRAPDRAAPVDGVGIALLIAAVGALAFGIVQTDVLGWRSALYASSKHAVEGYSQSLDHEVRGSGIRVVLVQPGYTRTTFESNALAADQKSEHYAPARANAEAVLRHEMTKGDAPEVVAATVVTAANATAPHLRYTAGRDATTVSLLRRFVPASAFDKSLRKRMQMPA